MPIRLITDERDKKILILTLLFNDFNQANR